MQIELRATSDRVLCAKEQSASRWWLMLKTQHGVCKGVASWQPKPGERIVLRGDWTVYNGERQFKFAAMLPDVPDDSRARLRYACEIAPGLGEGLADRIWTALGDGWEAIQPGDVKGVTEARCMALREAVEYIAVNADKVRVAAAMMTIGATFLQAEKAWEKWGRETIGIVEADCYRLTELPRVGFRDVDSRIRQHYGIGDTDPRRIAAGIRYAIGLCLADGSTVCGWPDLRTQAVQLLGVSREAICGAVREMLVGGALVGWKASGMIAEARAAEAEKTIWRYVA